MMIVANHDTTLIDQPVSEPPTLKGYLNKYTNVAKGYNTRWFVLKDGVLSCMHLIILHASARILA
jgi:oxysterol-binding protein 1